MQVLAIHGSPRKKGTTYKMLQRVEEGLKKHGEVDFEYLLLKDANLELCGGCGACLTVGEQACPLKDDREEIQRRMLQADGVIFACPVYAMSIPWLMKNFLDRFAYTMHRPRFFSQRTMLLCTAGAVGLKDALHTLSAVKYCGFDIVVRVGLATSMGTMSAASQRKIDADLEQASARYHAALVRDRRPPPTLSDLMAFRGQQAVFQLLGEQFPRDHAYFQEAGWFDPGRKYYVDAPVGPFKDMVARYVGSRTRAGIRKELGEG